MAEALRNITAETYAKAGKAFIGVQGHGFVVALEAKRIEGDLLPASLRQWGAWRAYFLRKKISHGIMERKGYYTVPAEWPHQFDADASMLDDMEAGQVFEREFRAQQARERSMADAVSRKAAAAAAKREFPRDAKRFRTPADHLEAEPKPSLIDEAQLLADWDTDMAAQDDRRRQKRNR